MEFQPLLDLLAPRSHTPEELVRRIHDNINNRANLNRYKDALAYWNDHDLRTMAFWNLESETPEAVEAVGKVLYKYVNVFNKMFFSEGFPGHRYKLVVCTPTQKECHARTRTAHAGTSIHPRTTTTLYLPSPMQQAKFQDLLVILLHEMVIAYFQLYSRPQNMESLLNRYVLGATGHGLWWYAACVTIESFVWKALGVKLNTSADFQFRSVVEGAIQGVASLNPR